MSRCVVTLVISAHLWEIKGMFFFLQHIQFWTWDWCWSHEFISSSYFSPAFPPVRWGSMMKPGWSSNRSTTPTWERVGSRRKSSPWVFVSAVRCLGRVSWCLRKQRGLYPATTGTGFNAFTKQDHIWIMKLLKAVLCHSGLFAVWAALWESLLVNTLLDLIINCITHL